MNLRSRLAILVTLAPAVMGWHVGSAQACSIDGVPSLTVNGYGVVINKTPPTGSALKVWAPFVLSFPLHTGRAEELSEITQRVALQPEAFKHPWRWNFGDGSPTVRGMSAKHTYSRPGVYKVTVEAYFASNSFWYTFDAVQIRVIHG